MAQNQLLSVSAKRDHIEHQTKARTPIHAVAELVWNAFDADANKVEVSLERNKLDEIERIEVADNGTGIDPILAHDAFQSLGGSWKRNSPRTRGNRSMHGKMGKGRFKAFALGKQVVWDTVTRHGEQIVRFPIKITAATIDKVSIGDFSPLKLHSPTGTLTRIEGIEGNLLSLQREKAIDDLARIFALYLAEYPNVRLIYEGQRVDPSTAIVRQDDINLGKVEIAPSAFVSAKLTVIEWRFDADRALYLCDSQGVALGDTTVSIHAPDFNFTAYLKSDLIRELDKDGWLVADELHPQLSNLIAAARLRLKDHFRSRRAELAQTLVQGWKDDKIYPFQGEPKTPVEKVERQVFDVLAANLSSSLPNFEETPTPTKKMAFSLVKHAIGESPKSLQKILLEVLNLPPEKQNDLADLLERTTLTAIINAAKEVGDRLNFLKGLEHILFDPVAKRLTKERSQLHRMLANETWLFGEEYHLTADDESLQTVLRRHRYLLGREEEDIEPVLREDGSVAIVDLMLSRMLTRTRAETREHLIVELKRPLQPINAKILQQLRSYATAVSKDDRFRAAGVRWSFWVIADDITDDAEEDCNQHDREPGNFFQSKDGFVVGWAKRWSQVLLDAEARLRFFRERLDYAATNETGLAHLQKTYDKYLPSPLKVLPEVAGAEP